MVPYTSQNRRNNNEENQQSICRVSLRHEGSKKICKQALCGNIDDKAIYLSVDVSNDLTFQELDKN